jgi:hypothetical protein
VSLSKLEKLKIAAIIAPAVREADRTKRIKTLDSQGRPTGKYVTQAELIERQFIRAGIEITRDPKKGVRPKALRCECGMPFLVPARPNGKRGGRDRIPTRCARCEADHWRCTNVIGGKRCAKRLSQTIWSPSRRADRNGKPPMCRRCAITLGRPALEAAKAASVSQKTHCHKGHPYAVESVKSGGRRCKICQRITGRESAQKRRDRERKARSGHG